MHELSLCRRIIEIVVDKLPISSVLKVVHVEVGKLACVDPDALLFSFDVCAKGTRAEGARLNIIEIEGKACCQYCGCILLITSRYQSCNQCVNHALLILSGEELNVKSMEIE